MKQVTKAEFFQAINAKNLDVHPSIENRFEKDGRGYIQTWKFKNGQVYGRTHTGNMVSTPAEYFVN